MEMNNGDNFSNFVNFNVTIKLILYLLKALVSRLQISCHIKKITIDGLVGDHTWSKLEVKNKYNFMTLPDRFRNCSIHDRRRRHCRNSGHWFHLNQFTNIGAMPVLVMLTKKLLWEIELLREYFP